MQNSNQYDPYNQQYSQYDQQYGGYGYAQQNQISAEAYNLIIGGTLLYGFLINCFMISFCFESILGLFSEPILFYLIYFILVIAGTTMVNKSDKPSISFIGYNLIVLPLGMIISIVVNTYAMAGYQTTIAAAFGLTAVVTLIMMFLSTMFPRFFLSIGTTLMVTLLITIVLELIMFFLGFSLGIIDYVVVLIFCGYIGYDWARAQQNAKTVDNAIDAAAELYVDIINLFLRLLRILARANNN